MRFTAPAVVAVVALATPAFATFPYPAPPPGTPPQQYATYLRLPATVPPTRPSDFAGGDAWKLTSDQSGDPAIDASPRELFGVTGMSVDLAWQVTTGRPDVVIAVLDSGILYFGDAGPDLARKVYLNRGELPLPLDYLERTKPEANPHPLNPDPYDLNDDGVFNALDYGDRADGGGDYRVSDWNSNGIIDPEDIIHAFSDGTDADHNGYVDDIAGWNFLDDDNDPFDEVEYGHGTGEARDSTAEADNGGDLGTCPNCMVLPVRVGDSFVADANHFGQGVVFAVDSGAHVIQEALGAVNNPSFAREAITYAVEHHVPVIASAADEESFHHNFPAANPYTIVVNSVTQYGDLAGLVMNPRSYLYLNGCTNYGGNVAVAVSSSSCSSEATGRAAGIAGLLISAALDRVDAGVLTPASTDALGHVHPLYESEVRQLLTTTADDIDFSGARDVDFGFPGLFTSTRFASQPGWDQYFGYGRLNAARAVQAVATGALPPIAEFSHLDWWQTYDPETVPSTAVQVFASAPRASSYDAEVAFGCGVQPAEDAFHVIGTAIGQTLALPGSTLTNFDPGKAAATCAFDPAEVAQTAPSGTPSPGNTPDQFTITLRLRVTDDQHRRSEVRRTIYVHHDPDLRRGFPLPIGGSGEPSPLFVPLRGRGKRANEQLLVATSSGAVHAFLPGGRELPGFPVFTDPLPLHTGSAAFATAALPPASHGSPTYNESIGNGLAAADLDGDGRIEIVAGTLAGKVYVWDRKGRRRPGFPVTSDPRFSARTIRDRYNRLQRGFIAPPVLADLDGDGTLEIIAACMDRHVYVWRHDGTPLPGWPVLVVDRTQVYIDPTTHNVLPRLVNGEIVALQGTKIVSTPAVGPLLGDGKPVVVVGTNEEYRETPNFSSERNANINLFVAAGVLSRANGRIYAIPAGGNDDPLVAGSATGPFLDGWPAHVAVLADELLPWIEGVPGSPALADVDGDGKLEVGIASVAGPAYVLRADGTSFHGTGADARPRTLPTDKATFGAATTTTDGPSVPSLGSVVFAPIGPDGDVVLVAPGAGFGRLADAQAPAEQLPHDVHLDAWNARTGDFLPAFPQVLDDLVFFSEPSVADVSGDGAPEILIGSGGYLVHAVDAAGTEAPGWPKFTGGWIIASPAVSQRFGKGQAVALTTREGNLYVWKGRGKRKSVAPWPRYHHDARNTGYLPR